ncbi:MAG TPA: 4-hydroxy-tetrahydrodipicolinate reductase [Steroidobacteraceae bacterium]|nr:4-hydroxy-tetrahydrodipicolinate reductase [Steroidobacteraceae bacterium]
MTVTSRVGIVGAAGRMGMELVKVLRDTPGARLAAAIDRPDGASVGKDAGEVAGLPAIGVRIGADLAAVIGGLDVLIDFSTGAAVAATATVCGAAGVALLVGTTALDENARHQLDAAAGKIPLLISANTSLALNVLLNLVRQAARALPAGYDIEILEAHHRHKIDAPSGTALALGEAAAAGRGERLASPVGVTGATAGARQPGSIGFSVVRGGDVVGEHDVRFLGPGEQLRLSHVATDRAIFARGAVAAALWLVKRPAGRYQMADFIFKDQLDTE